MSGDKPVAMKRELVEHGETGFFFRIERGGRFDTLDLAQCTEREIEDQVIANRSPSWLASLVNGLAKKAAR